MPIEREALDAGWRELGLTRKAYAWFASAALLANLALASAPDRPAAQASNGAQLFTLLCAGCHGRSGEGVYGPPLAGVVNEKFATVEDEVEFVSAGTGRGMPAFATQLTKAELRAIAEFTRTLPKPADD